MCAFLSFSLALPISIKNICDQTRIRMYTPYIAIELSYALFWVIMRYMKGTGQPFRKTWL